MMGRSFQSVRMGVQDIAGRWERAARAMQGKDAACAKKVVIMAKKYASEAFYAFDDPLEAALFSVLISLGREPGQGNVPAKPGEDPAFKSSSPCASSGNPPGDPGK
jgi:hypothetical protein